MADAPHFSVRLLLSGGSSEVTLALCACLQGMGVETGSFDAPGPVLLLDTTGEDLTGQVRSASSDGNRLLAVDCSGTSGSSNGWKLLAAGACDAIRCADPDKCARAIAGRFRRWSEIDRLADSAAVSELVVGRSPAWRRVVRDIVEMAAFTNAPVLIMGESGTGKELVARLIHTLDRRANKGELVLLDCSTVIPELAGSEFFGHEKGSYTGASQGRDGAFAMADQGSLFLDEIGELPPALQAQLLRAVQEKTYKRLGSNLWRQTDFRLVSATNRDLLAEVEGGGFRRDLYYRIASWVCRLPPLRERPEDILLLARYFLREFSAAEDFDPPVENYLLSRSYPGNVRDLRQIVARLAYRHEGAGNISVGDLPADDRPLGMEGEDWRDAPFRRSVQRALSLGSGLKEIGRAAEDLAEEMVLREEDGNLQRAAKRLGITDRALQMRRQLRKQAAS